MRKLLLAVCTAWFCFQPGISGDDDRVWLTIGDDAFGSMQKMIRLQAKDNAMPDVARGNGIVLTRLDEKHISTLSWLMHRDFNRCAGFIAHDSYEEALAALNGPQRKAANLVTYSIDNALITNTMISDTGEAGILTVINQLASYHTRYYTTATGVSAANWLKSHWEGLANGRSDVTVELYNHSWAQPSVIFTITGSTLPNEVVVIGGHLDSTNGGGSNPAPGADDDASGIGTFTEAIRVAMLNDYKPERTVKFMAYAAEEVGLRGSGDIAQDYANSGVNVVGVLQLDMTNYNGSSSDIYLYQDYTNSAQNSFVADLVDTYVGVSRSTSSCGYGCSDHASWHNRGFAASFPFEAQFGQHNPYIHSANDTLANSGNDAAHALKFAKLTVAYMAELAKGDFSGPGGGGGNNPPNASFTHTTNLLTADFDASGSSDSDGTITGYSWDFGDGNNGSGVTPSHTYASSGTYSVTLTVTDDDGATDTFNDSVTASSGGGGSWTTLTSDDFESGWGNFNDGGSDVRRSANDSAFAHQGTYCVRIRDNSGSVSAMSGDPMNLTAYSELEISFWYQPVSMENGEDFFVEYNDGGGWVVIASYASGSEFSNGNFYNPTVTITDSSYNFTSNAQVRIRCDASGNGDRVYIDEVVVRAR